MGIEIVLDPTTKVPGDEMGTAISARCMETGLSCNVVQLKGMGVSCDLLVCRADDRELFALPRHLPSQKKNYTKGSRSWTTLLHMFLSREPAKRRPRVKPRPLSDLSDSSQRLCNSVWDVNLTG